MSETNSDFFDLSGVVQIKDPLRYNDLQKQLMTVFNSFETDEEKDAAFTLFSFLSQYLWTIWFEHKYPLKPRTLIKTLDDTVEAMGEELMYGDIARDVQNGIYEKEDAEDNFDADVYLENSE